jgi:AAA-like domain
MMSEPEPQKRNTDTVQLPVQGIRRVRDRISERISQEKTRLRAENSELNYTRHEVASQADVSIDTLNRFLGERGGKVRRKYAEKITKLLELDLDDLIESNRSQRPSDFYVERPPLEDLCYEEIFSDAGTLVRVKAPHRTGKTWFVEQLMSRVNKTRFLKVTLSFHTADKDIFTDLNKFLNWFCLRIGDSLDLHSQLGKKWQDGLGSNYINYFETYLWANIKTPLVLILEDVDLVFEQPDVSLDFCSLLRSWHDAARRPNNKSWQYPRFVIVHSTDLYGGLDINRSPLAAVGPVFSLRNFNFEEVTVLIQQYEFLWGKDRIQQFVELTGGNPYLVHNALNHLKLNPKITLETFLKNVAIGPNPYHNHLCELFITLQKNNNLVSAFKEVVNSVTPVKVKEDPKFQLYSMGLIEWVEGGAVPSCELYRQYFRDRL